WPGSTHDNTIFENCGLKAWVEANNIRPTTQQENAFNLAHSRTRMVVERAFGLLKSRFRCLHKTGGFLQITPEKAAKVFVVCAKLHNMCIDDAVVFDGQIHVAPDNAPPYIGALDPNAQRDRRAIIARF
ncbi:HARB1-like protein, partial [Mya arenaria]